MSYCSMVEKEHSQAHVSLVNYELSRQEHTGSDFEGEVAKEGIIH